MFNFLKRAFRAAYTVPVSQLELQLRTVSIRGRVAYCTACLETVFQSKHVNSTASKALLACLWEFTSSSDLSEWEEKIACFYSDSVLESENDQQNSSPSVPFQQLRDTYSALPKSLLQCIDEAIEVGRGNLYAGTVGYSECTLSSTMRVVRYMQKKDFPLPTLERFLRSPFTQEDHGWGKRVDRSYFQ